MGVEEIRDPVGDVVSDQADSFDAVDAAFGGFIGVPVLESVPATGSTWASRPRVTTTST